MKANADKCRLLVTRNYEASVNINEFKIEGSEKEKLGPLILDFLLITILHLFAKKPVKSYMRLQE